MTQNNSETPPYQTEDPNPEEFWEEWNEAEMSCPEFNGTLSCCNSQQNENMYTNFKALRATFGYDNGGCDVCAANLQRFWCYFTCSPNQSDFMVLGNVSEYIDPVNQMPILAREVNITLNSDFACEMFSSCSSTPIVTQLPSAGSGSLGLFTFLGTNGVQ